VRFLDEQAARIAAAGLKRSRQQRANAATQQQHCGALQTDGNTDSFQVPDNHLMPTYDFTNEAFIVLRSGKMSAYSPTIASRWDGPRPTRLVVGATGSKSTGKPQSLVLELIGDPAEDGGAVTITIASGLSVQLDTPYAAVSLRIGDTSETGVTFYLKELTAGAALQTVRVPHKVTANHQ
jgi:hypothetical protein